MNALLVTYLDAFDDRLLEHLDDGDEMSVDTVQQLSLYANALLEGSLSPADLAEDWPEWFDLAPAFVFVYGDDELEDLENEAALMGVIEAHEDIELTEIDRAYVAALEIELEAYILGRSSIASLAQKRREMAVMPTVEGMVRIEASSSPLVGAPSQQSLGVPAAN